MSKQQQRETRDIVPAEAPPEGGEVTVVTPSALEALTRASVDSAMTAAQRAPRSIGRFLSDAHALIAVNQETAESAFYTLRRRGADPIEGPSVRCAELLAAAYRNLRIAARVLEVGQSTVQAQGTCLDLERNVEVSVEVTRRITDRFGRRYSDDMIAVTAGAACSIARRNAVLAVIPRAFVDQVWHKAREVARGDAKTLGTRRERALKWFAGHGVPEARVLASLGRASVEDIDLDDLQTLQGLRNAIEEGALSAVEAFADEAATDAGTGVRGILERLRTAREPGTDG